MQSVLFVSLGFYNYDDKITATIKELGYEVTQFTPIGNYNTFEKLYNAFTKGQFLKKKCLKRQKQFMNDNPKKYDYVLVIVGRHLDPSLLAEYRKAQPQAKFILYLWDDIARVEGYEDNKGFYDEVYSFDLKDVAEHSVKHHPLFYVPDYLYHNDEKKYILSLSGTLHSGRVSLWDKIMTKYNLDANDCFLFLLGMKMEHYFKALLPSKDKWMSLKYIHIKGMNLEEMAVIMRQSKVSLDVQFGSQAGLTIRTFESLASKTKLITTNPYVKEYDFYQYGNICVVDKDNPEVPADFFDTPYNEIPQEITEKYSLYHWVYTMLGESQ